MTTIEILPKIGEICLDFINIILSAIAVGLGIACLTIVRGNLVSFFRYIVAGIGVWGLAELVEGFSLLGLIETEGHTVYHSLQLVSFFVMFVGFFKLWRLREELVAGE